MHSKGRWRTRLGELCRKDNNASVRRLFWPVLVIEHRMLYMNDSKGGKPGACCVGGIITRV